MPATASSLVVLGCSAKKFESEGNIPAVHLDHGPMFCVLRSRLRSHRWPERLNISILSAKYGLIGSVAPIQHYDQRMTAERAKELAPSINAALLKLAGTNRKVHLILGQDYLQSIDTRALSNHTTIEYAEGPIGEKLHKFSSLLFRQAKQERVRRTLPRSKRPLYFLPDWDDFLDVNYDFDTDTFSADSRSHRAELHS